MTNWSLVFNKPVCVDVEVDPNNGSIIYVTHGNFNFNLDPALSGIYKSTNKGNTFSELLDPGLITAWSGTAKLTFDPTNSNTLYADIQVGWFNNNPTTPAGIYRTTNRGTNWVKINEQNIARFQGWYSHDLAINPQNPDEHIYVGVDAWKSTNGGNVFTIKSDWQLWPFGPLPPDVPEGGDRYVHADIHAAYYHPLVANKVFLATDGGVFSSADGGETWTTLNGGLHTTQFYADMGSSATDPGFLIGGTQDNASYIYRGTPTWERVLGGDGMSAAVNQEDDRIVYGSAQGLFLQKSTDRGMNFVGVRPTLIANDFPAFSAPYVLAPSDNDIVYAGTTILYRSTDGADSWVSVNQQAIDGSNVILKIAVSHSDPDKLLISTAPNPFNPAGPAKVMLSLDGGNTFSIMQGLPDRICRDIEFDPLNDAIAYAVFSGFGSAHAYRTENGGDSWTAIDDGLPDVPTNTLLIDPENPDYLYLGNDLGVYFSSNAGTSWVALCDGLPDATYVMDLNYSPSNRKVRIATHGVGIYQRDMVTELVSASDLQQMVFNFRLFPNPAATEVQNRPGPGNGARCRQIAGDRSLGQDPRPLVRGGSQKRRSFLYLVAGGKYPCGNLLRSPGGGRQKHGQAADLLVIPFDPGIYHFLSWL